jgi:hypothetical protein
MLKNCAFAIVALSSCLGLTFSQGQQKQVAYQPYPLKVGHRWTYVATDVKAGQAKADKKQRVVIEVEREEVYVENVFVDGKVVQENHPCFLLKQTSGGKTTHDLVLLTEKGLDIMDKAAKDANPNVRSQGLHRIHTAGTPLTPPLKIVPFPYKPNIQWTANSTSGNTVMKGTFTTFAVGVKVPFGEFKQNVLHVAYREQQKGDLRIEIDYWFAHDVGMVKQIVLELEKFEPAK